MVDMGLVKMGGRDEWFMLVMYNLLDSLRFHLNDDEAMLKGIRLVNALMTPTRIELDEKDTVDKQIKEYCDDLDKLWAKIDEDGSKDAFPIAMEMLEIMMKILQKSGMLGGDRTFKALRYTRKTYQPGVKEDENAGVATGQAV